MAISLMGLMKTTLKVILGFPICLYPPVLRGTSSGSFPMKMVDLLLDFGDQLDVVVGTENINMTR